jgi:hypothetical protein
MYSGIYSRVGSCWKCNRHSRTPARIQGQPFFSRILHFRRSRTPNRSHDRLEHTRARLSGPCCNRPPGRRKLYCFLAMRRTIALALTMIFSWMLIAPVFGPDADAHLPPCCRRNGKHHCMMRMEQFSSNRKGFTSISGKCPCLAASTCAVYSPIFHPKIRQQFPAGVIRGPVCLAQRVGRLQLSFLRGHPKRGPPPPLT